MKRYILIAFKKGKPVSTETGTYADLKAKVKAAQAAGKHAKFDELHLVESHHTWLNKAEATSQPRATVTFAKPADADTPPADDGDDTKDD